MQVNKIHNEQFKLSTYEPYNGVPHFWDSKDGIKDRDSHSGFLRFWNGKHVIEDPN